MPACASSANNSEDLLHGEKGQDSLTNMLVSGGFQEVLSYISANVQIVCLLNEMCFLYIFIYY